VAISATAGAGMALRRVYGVVIAVVAVSSSYLATTLPYGTESQRLTVLVNSFAIVAFAAVAMAGSRFLRRLGADSDAARASAAEAARAAATGTDCCCTTRRRCCAC
jgi:hypothetical protein